MSGKIQIRLAVLAALAALVAVMVPSGLAFGNHDGASDGSSFGVLRLHMADDGDFFEVDGGSADGANQAIDVTRCEVTLSGDSLVSLGGTSHRGPGYKDHGMGVKSGGSQGVACSRVGGSELLKMSLTAGQLAGLEVAEAQIDVEVKMGAEVVLTTYREGTQLETFKLRSGDSIVEGEGSNQEEMYLAVSTSDEPIANCRQRSDSGPDAGALDNCRWVVEDMVPFDTMEFTAGAGEFTIEGGNDGTAAANAASEASYGSDTLFFLTDVLECGEDITVDDDDVSAIFTLLSVDGNTTGPDCFKIINQAFASDVDGAREVVLVTGGAGTAVFVGTITADNELLDSDKTVGQLDDFGLFLDPDGPDGNSTFQALEPCIDADGDLEPPASGWGYVEGTATPTSLDGDAVYGTESWDVCGADDPGFRF